MNVMNTFGETYAAGQYINGYDSDNAIFYKSDKFNFVSNTPIYTALRDISELQLVHSTAGDTLRIYSVHLQAGNSGSSQTARVAEVDSLRKWTNALPTGTNFMVCGDFNFYSAETSYLKLLQDNVNDDGNFMDPITMTGTWSSVANALHHTQSPRGGSFGGLDDRFDLILYSTAMDPVNNAGIIDYVPGSYTVYGNDGQHYNDSVNKPPNSAVPQNIADALEGASDHLPLYAEFLFENGNGIVQGRKPQTVLFQNVPNPFHASASIKFSLAGKSLVKLKVYDLYGREIAMPVDAVMKAGSHAATFNVPENFPSGIYFYMLQTDDFTGVRKMLIN